MDILAAKKFQQSTELANTHPFEDVHLMLENWIGFIRESSSDDFFNTGLAGCGSEQSRVNAVTGDDAQDMW